MKELLSVGPASVADHETVIARGYKSWSTLSLGAIPIAVASLADIKWVETVGIVVVILLAHQFDGRLHDLGVRVRRTNSLLREIRGDASEP